MSFLVSFFILFVAIFFLLGGLSLAPWVPTKKEAIKRLGDTVDIQAGENFLEIGSGDGRVILSLAQKFPHAHFHGVEIVPYFYFFSLMRMKYFGVKNTKFSYGNALKINYFNYQHIFIFGLPESIEKKVLPKFEREAKSGTKLYSYAFSFPKSTSSQVESIGEPGVQKIHIYTKA